MPALPRGGYYLTADEAARLFGWSPAYVRKLAHRDQWRRTPTRPTGYLADDILDTHNRARRKPLTST